MSSYDLEVETIAAGVERKNVHCNTHPKSNDRVISFKREPDAAIRSRIIHIGNPTGRNVA